MSERYGDEEIDRLLNAAHCPSLPLKGVIRQLRADLAFNVQALHELQAGATRDREEIVKLREALRTCYPGSQRNCGECQVVSHIEQSDALCAEHEHVSKLLGEGEK